MKRLPRLMPPNPPKGPTPTGPLGRIRKLMKSEVLSAPTAVARSRVSPLVELVLWAASGRNAELPVVANPPNAREPPAIVAPGGLFRQGSPQPTPPLLPASTPPTA